MTLYLALAAATFVRVFLKAFQQRNVVGNQYAWVVPTSLGLAAAEIYVIVAVAMAGFDLIAVLAIGLSGGTGSIAAMLLHNHLFKEKPSAREQSCL